jgi:hypothetical protein
MAHAVLPPPAAANHRTWNEASQRTIQPSKASATLKERKVVRIITLTSVMVIAHLMIGTRPSRTWLLLAGSFHVSLSDPPLRLSSPAVRLSATRGSVGSVFTFHTLVQLATRAVAALFSRKPSQVLQGALSDRPRCARASLVLIVSMQIRIGRGVVTNSASPEMRNELTQF